MKTLLIIHLALVTAVAGAVEPTYPIVDTGQIRCYDNTTEIAYPQSGQVFFGQDAHYSGSRPAYQDNGDGTVTDLVTGLMWTQDPGAKRTFEQAVADASTCRVGDYTDWRLPTIKELYSLILFSGTDLDPMSTNTADQRPFIDTTYFKFQYGNPDEGDRVIDSQFATSTTYLSTTMGDNETMFGVNFADGRIKGYPIGSRPGGPGEKTFYTLYVRGNVNYGRNRFVDNDDGTVTDEATGLMWMKVDSGAFDVGHNGALNWQEALAFAENLDYAGHDDWRLPNVKELQSIVDYSRCPGATQSAAIDPIFSVTPITNEGGDLDYPFYWTGTSHCSIDRAESADYVAFGRALGWMQYPPTFVPELQDVHGAGAQRSDPKAGDPAEFPYGRGPQGDVIRIYNYVRCVRGGVAEAQPSGPEVAMRSWPRMRPGPMVGPMAGAMGGQRRGQMPGQQPSPEDFIRRLDRDGDGQVSRPEFDGPPEAFDRTDANADGYLDLNEAAHIPPPPPGARRGR